MTWSVSIDRDLCMGSGMCLVYAPGTFEHDTATKAVLIDRPSDELEAVQIAVEACPTRALQLLIDDEGT